MNSKKNYESPETEIVLFNAEDIIITSAGLDENEVPLDPSDTSNTAQ